MTRIIIALLALGVATTATIMFLHREAPSKESLALNMEDRPGQLGGHRQSAGDDENGSRVMQTGRGAVAQNVNSWARRFCVTPNDFGAVGDGVSDDTAALKSAIAASITRPPRSAKCLYLPGGHTYLATSSISITMPANSIGPVISGDGGYNSQIKFASGGLALTSTTAMFYGSIHDFSVVCNSAGPCLRFSSDPTDAINGFNISNIVVNNISSDPANMGVQFNGVYASHIDLTSNCSGSGNGAGVQITAGTMNTGQIAAGHCKVGLSLTNNINSVSGNVFTGNDLEVNSIGLQIDGSAVTRNSFIGGIYTSYAKGDYGINALAGVGNIILNPLFGGEGGLCKSGAGLIIEGTAATGGFDCAGANFFGEITINTHKGYFGSSPLLGVCPGGEFSPGSTDTAGLVRMAKGTSCSIHFRSGYNSPPFCNITPGSASSVGASALTSELVATFGVPQTSWSYQCFGT